MVGPPLDPQDFVVPSTTNGGAVRVGNFVVTQGAAAAVEPLLNPIPFLHLFLLPTLVVLMTLITASRTLSLRKVFIGWALTAAALGTVVQTFWVGRRAHEVDVVDALTLVVEVMMMARCVKQHYHRGCVLFALVRESGLDVDLFLVWMQQNTHSVWCSVSYW